MHAKILDANEFQSAPRVDWVAECLLAKGHVTLLHASKPEVAVGIGRNWTLAGGVGAVWGTRRFQQGEVLYVPASPGEALKPMETLLSFANGRTGLMHFSDGPIHLGLDPVAEWPDFNALARRPELIVFDTIEACMAPWGEQVPYEAASLLHKNLQWLRVNQGAAVLAVYAGIPCSPLYKMLKLLSSIDVYVECQGDPTQAGEQAATVRVTALGCGGGVETRVLLDTLYRGDALRT